MGSVKIMLKIILLKKFHCGFQEKKTGPSIFFIEERDNKGAKEEEC